MESIIFKCEIITPMFLAGACGDHPELRAPSIKGALRFWWRAMNGDKGIDQLRKEEADIFGGTDEKVGRSKIIIRTNHPALTISQHKPVPHKNYFIQAYDANIRQVFQVTLSLSSEKNGFDLKKLKSLFILTCLLGGYGKRSRRGFGSIRITEITGCDALDAEKSNNQISFQNIFQNILSLSNSYTLDDPINPSKIVLKSLSLINNNLFPYIEEIQIGTTKYSKDDLLMVVSNATHTHKGTVPNEPSLGYVDRGERLASPVYVSSIKQPSNDYHTIITTLYMATNNGSVVNRSKQINFMKAIL